MKVGGESWLVPLSPFDWHCTYWPAESTATTTPSQSSVARGVRTATTAWYRDASAPRQEERIRVAVPASIGVVVASVTVKSASGEVPPGEDDALGLGAGVELAGSAPPCAGSAAPGPALPDPPSTTTAATLIAVTPVATPSGTPHLIAHLRRDGVPLFSGPIFISSSSRVRRWFGRSRSEGAAGTPCGSFIVRPPSR